MSPAPFLYGLALIVSGWIAASAVTASSRIRLRDRIEGPGDASGGPRTGSAGAWRPRLDPGRSRLLLAAAVAAVAFAMVGSVGVLIGLVATPLVTRAVSRRGAARKREALEGQLREAVIAMAAGLRAGLSTRLAVAEATRDAEPPMTDALDAVLRSLDLGEPLDVALERLLSALELADATLLVNVLRIHRRTGGDLPALLDKVAEVIGGRTAERRQLRVMTAQAKASGAVLAALPVAFVALLSGAGGDGLGVFYRSPLGVMLLLSGVVLDAAGFAWMRRIVRGVEEAA